MSFYPILIVTLALGVMVWKAMNRFTRRKPNSDNQQQSYTKTGQLSTENQAVAVVSVQQLQTESMCVAHKQQTTSSSEVQRAKSETTEAAYLELCAERTLRENAEDWAEFLARELDVCIKSCNEAEKKLKRIGAGHSPQISPRTYKDSTAAQLVWKNNRLQKSKTERMHTGNTLKLETEDDENEWNEIVNTNLRFLEGNAFHLRTSKTQIQNQSEDLKAHDLVNENRTPIEITVEQFETSEEREALVTRSKSNHIQSDRDREHLAVSPDDEELGNIVHKMENDSPVCEENFIDVKKATQMWETTTTSRQKLESTDDLSPTSDSTLSNKSPSISSDEITPGLVEKNLKMWQQSFDGDAC